MSDNHMIPVACRYFEFVSDQEFLTRFSCLVTEYVRLADYTFLRKDNLSPAYDQTIVLCARKVLQAERLKYHADGRFTDEELNGLCDDITHELRAVRIRK